MCVLPSALASGDPERGTRFAREARLLASLNHPNIAAIYGVEESAGVTGVVLELVEGPALEDRLSTGRIEFPDALADRADGAEIVVGVMRTSGDIVLAER